MVTSNCNKTGRKTTIFHHIIMFSVILLLLLSADIIVLVLGPLEPGILFTTQGREVGCFMFTEEDFSPCGRKPVLAKKTDAVAMWKYL